MDVETRIHLNKFKPRDYQLSLCKAFEEHSFKKLIAIWPRRSGKDICAFNLLIRAAIRRVGIYYYLLPNAVQARRVMFDGITSEGQRIIDFIPKELILNINIQQMKITLINNSSITFVGSENFDSLRGTNPIGCVMSEAAYSHPQAFPTLRPILLQNNGFILFISTPFAENWFYTLYQIALDNPDEWYVDLQTTHDTRHISLEQIQKEIDMGEISPDMAQQEYFCDFSIGAIGAFYSKYLIQMENNNQVGQIDWEPNYPVHSSWDLGMSDQTCILNFQVIGRSVHIIDMYINSDVGLEHYINVLQAKHYTWGKHIGPHDLAVRDFTGGGLSRIEKAAQLNFNFILAPNLSIIDGIESVRTTLPRIYIDREKCKPLIAALRNYRKEYDAANKVYRNKPKHDNNSHICDALRYLCLSLPQIKDTGRTAEELDEMYRKSRANYQGDMPNFFRDDRWKY